MASLRCVFFSAINKQDVYPFPNVCRRHYMTAGCL